MSSLSGRIPHQLEVDIDELLQRYAYNLTSMLEQFPSLQVLHCICT